MLTRQQQKTAIEQQKHQGLQRQRTLASLTKANLSLRRQLANLQHIHRLLHSSQYQTLLEDVARSYELLLSVREDYQKAACSQKAKVENILRMSTKNTHLRSSIANLEHAIKVEEQSRATKLQQRKDTLAFLQNLTKKIENLYQAKLTFPSQDTKSSKEKELVQKLLVENGAERDLQSSRSTLLASLHHHQFRTASCNIELQLQLQELEIKANERHILLQQLQRTHHDLEKKYSKTTHPASSDIQLFQYSEKTLQERLESLQKEHTDVITEIQFQIVQECRVTKNTKELALSQALRKVKRFIAPKQEEIDKKRKAVEEMIPIISSSCGLVTGEVEALMADFQQLKVEQQHLGCLLIPEDPNHQKPSS